MMNLGEIKEFRTTWNNEFFYKSKSTVLTAKHLIKKSIVIVQTRLCRQLKYIEDDLRKELQTVEHDKQILKSSLADNLQDRLQILQNEIDNYNIQIKHLVKQEKDYWKQLEQTISNRRTNLHKPTTNKLTTSQTTSNPRPTVLVNATFVMHVDKNNENLPPSLEKIPKIRKKKKCIS